MKVTKFDCIEMMHRVWLWGLAFIYTKGIKSAVGFLNGDFKVKVQHRRYRGVMARRPNLALPLLAVLPRSAGDSFEVQRR
jgi:hypothetical protein